MANINNAPTEILEKIQSNLPFFDLLNCRNVCKRWEALFAANMRKWHYDSVFDATTLDLDGVHCLLKLDSGHGKEFGTAYQLVGLAQGRLLQEIHAYSLRAQTICRSEPGLGCLSCQSRKLNDPINYAVAGLSRPVVLTESSLLDEPLFYHKSEGKEDALHAQRTDEEQVFYDWMQSYDITLTYGSGKYFTHHCVPADRSRLAADTTLFVMNFDLNHPNYSKMTVREFIDNAWEDFKSIIWTKHRTTFAPEKMSSVIMVIKELEFSGVTRCWFFCWHELVFDGTGSLSFSMFLDGTEYLSKLLTKIPGRDL
ncbi:hypothetical protein TWF718_006444 [Orbilia javanica]|uniref:F-box domain-containing protein n=1 Tax=Orbilia javanica TaxID=47235 RepID=A0AAN8REY6_9PEZI